ncbi:MAG: TonB-dependent receptor [Candidatus Marinimicrobia bacterium]|nr:TonB-dependent receptor [Candidatus Neomarinimicrobiota bacterium]
MVPALALAQGTIAGTVTDSNTGDALPGANVIVVGQAFGGASDLTGAFVIEGIPAGNYSVTASVIGYETVSLDAQVANGVVTTLNFALSSEALEMSALEVVASRATRETPVAYSDVPKEEMNLRLGSRDIPLVLTTTPSVYATESGGGAGDGRVNVRGFNQRNVAIMINGVPVNDMENGWVYWSNWDGVADATSSIQMQRGLSAVNLAAPSIGGTMNILTDPATHKKGGSLKQEFGDGSFLKTTLSYHSGMINDNLALGATIVRKTGDGLIDKTWTDAWAYYFGASYAASDAHRFELYALGAPQRHGQMRYAQNIAAYDSTYAKSIDGYNDAGVRTFVQDPAGRFYNENWNPVSSSYTGQQYFYMYGDKTVDRYDPDFLNENENYYHKPQVNLNWYWTLSKMMRLSTIAYFSGGSGGGSGTYGDMLWEYDGPSRAVDWDGTIDINEGTANRRGNAKPAGEAVGILRNSINRQWTVGAISKLNIDLSEALKVQVGVDWRTAEIEHNREVRDLLGGSYTYNAVYNNRATADPRWGSYQNEFDATLEDTKVGLGDIIDYNNTNTVDWLGFFGQAEWKNNLMSFYGMGGYSMVKYGFQDFFKKASNYDFSYVETGDDGEVVINSDWVSALQAKGGGLYKVTSDLDVFANFGWVQKVPIFDNVIDDITAAMSSDPTNETFISTEFGLNFNTLQGKLDTKFNYYITKWQDRNLTIPVTPGQGTSGDTDMIFLTGLNQDHNGFEAEIAYRPINLVRLDAALSIGDWKYASDATGAYKDQVNNTTTEYEYAVEGLMVGDQPQTSYALGLSVFPVKGLTLRGTMFMYDNFYANWDPESRQIDDADDDGVISQTERDAADREQSWMVPGYSKIDLHATYDLPVSIAGFRAQVFFHMFNALDEIYISDALDNSPYNAYTADGVNHKADDAEVYLGSPRRMNLGLTVSF